jgi:peptidoglycan/LPS O-acetylase OafA/YrhL
MDAVALNEPISAATPTASPKTVERIGAIHLFRGLAILQVACLHATHALYLRGLAGSVPERSPLYIAFDVALHDSTIYFAVISGFLYAHLFVHRSYGPFLRSRLQQVALPYLVITVALTVPQHGAFSPALVSEIGHNLLSGDAWNTLWYIPVILLLYAASPLLHALVAGRAGRIAGIALLLAPLLMSRTGTDLTMQSLVYFAGAYAAGMALRLSPQGWEQAIVRLTPWAAPIAALSSLALCAAYAASIDMAGPISIRETLFYVQKLSLTCLFLAIALRWALRPAIMRDAVLGVLASAAFGIYFLHGPIMRLIAKLVGAHLPGGEIAAAAAILLILVLGVLGSLAIIRLLQMLLGRRSRWVVGA